MIKDELLKALEDRYKDINQIFTYREYSYFYNPNKLLPRGVYFATIKESDGINDKASNLDRDGVYRLSFGLSKKTYERLFGAKPKRPLKGKIVDTRDDFTALNILTPHPIYAWMGWVQILNPELEQLYMITELLDERYEIVKNEFSKNLIRKFKGDDIDAIMKIWLDVNITSHNYIPSSYWLNNVVMVRELIPLAEVYVCEINNEIKGFIGVMNGCIAGIFVVDEYQSRGIGSVLLNKVKDRYKKLTLNVYTKNSKALGFYIRECFDEQSRGIDQNTNEQEVKMIWESYE